MHLVSLTAEFKFPPPGADKPTVTIHPSE